MSIRMDAPITVKGSVKATQASQQGEAVVLDSTLKIPYTLIPDNITSKANKYTVAQVNIVALYQTYSASQALRTEIQSMWDDGDESVQYDQFLVLIDEGHSSRMTLYTFMGATGFQATELSIQKLNGNTVGASNQPIYINAGTPTAGKQFLSGTSIPDDSTGNDGDIYFRYTLNV